MTRRRWLERGMVIAKMNQSRGEERIYDVLGYTRRGKLIMWERGNSTPTKVWWSDERDLPKGYYIKEKD